MIDISKDEGRNGVLPSERLVVTDEKQQSKTNAFGVGLATINEVDEARFNATLHKDRHEWGYNWG